MCATAKSNIKEFLDEDFLLDNPVAQVLYHDFAESMPIIDYHSHLDPRQLSNDHMFENLTQIWLQGDHYKWRAMRALGVAEEFITGNADDLQKFGKWASTVPHTLRNPLFHWTHLELKRYFGVNELLNEKSANHIYEHCNEKLQTPEYSTQALIRKMNVEVVCTTDDPIDDLKIVGLKCSLHSGRIAAC